MNDSNDNNRTFMNRTQIASINKKGCDITKLIMTMAVVIMVIV